MESHLNGIDFSHPVEVIKVGKGQQFYQWDSPTTYRGGQYFAFLDSSRPTELGINPRKEGFGTDIIFKRIQSPLVTHRSVEVLKTTAAPIIDNWSIQNEPYITKGGAQQAFTPDLEAFKLNSWKYYDN